METRVVDETNFVAGKRVSGAVLIGAGAHFGSPASALASISTQKLSEAALRLGLQGAAEKDQKGKR